jgi:hypothetical protein
VSGSMNTDAPKATESRVKILKYHGRTFVTGMRWVPLGSVPSYMKEARQFGKEHDLDIVAIRRTSSLIQAGFVSRSAGVNKGMYSLAATLAGQLGDSWIAAWRVTPDEDQYAVIAVHKGSIIPGCDRVGTELEVRKRIAQQRSKGINFSLEYLPTEFAMGGEPFEIEELLQPSRLKREYRLRPLVFGLSKAELAQFVALGLVGAIGVGGWMLWQSHQAELDRQARLKAEQERLEELARLNEQTGIEQPAQALEHPWAKTPSVEVFIEACSRVVYKLPPSINGWPFIEATCNEDQVLANYQRTGNSTAQELITAVDQIFSDRPSFFENGKNVTLRFDLSLPAAGDEPLQDSYSAVTALTSWFHGFSQDPSVKEVPVETVQQPALPGQPAPPPPPPPQWKQFELLYSSGILPYDSFNGAPTQGLRLQEIKTEYKAEHLIWSVTGVLYAK